MPVHPSVRTGRSTNQLVALIAGAVFLLVGLLGFTVSGGHHAAGTEGGHLLGIFEVNVLHNIVHLAVGAGLIAGSLAGPRLARTTNTIVGAVYLLVGLLGLFLIGTSANIIALNGWDNGLHLLSGAALLVIGTGLWSGCTAG